MFTVSWHAVGGYDVDGQNGERLDTGVTAAVNAVAPVQLFSVGDDASQIKPFPEQGESTPAGITVVNPVRAVFGVNVPGAIVLRSLTVDCIT
jgi:hypothetical protein